MKILLFANTDWYLYNFRLHLLHTLRAEGAEVVLVSPAGDYGSRLQSEGFRWIALPMERRSLNPLREAFVIWHLARVYRRERPDVVHHFTTKCVIYGAVAARLAGVHRQIHAIAGLGYLFSSNRLRARIVRPLVYELVRLALRGAQTRVVLQNERDHAMFQCTARADADNIRLIEGSGVDTARFRPPSGALRRGLPFRVILAARLLWDKGIQEYVDAAAQLKLAGLPIEFLLAGSPDHGNPAGVPQETILGWNAAGLITSLGHVDDIVDWLHKVDLAVLPSYREGLSRSLVEAAACGLPIVTTDAPGCREVVEDGCGLSVPCRDSAALASAIRWMYENPAARARMGVAARQKVLSKFDERIVLAKTLAVYEELFPGQLCTHSDRIAARSPMQHAGVESESRLG